MKLTDKLYKNDLFAERKNELLLYPETQLLHFASLLKGLQAYYKDVLKNKKILNIVKFV